jgi:hypothetical protein
MAPRLPPSLKLRRAQLYNPGEALAETGRGDDGYSNVYLVALCKYAMRSARSGVQVG